MHSEHYQRLSLQTIHAEITQAGVKAMPAPKGNRFWEARSSSGRKPIFSNPNDLWEMAQEYFEWVEKNPLMDSELVKFQGEAKVVEVPKMRAMTISGLCLFLDISKDTLASYRKKKDFIAVITRIEEIIYTQKFTGASADLLNANIIARDLGLADKKEVKETSYSIEDIDKLAEILTAAGVDVNAIK